MSPNQAWIDLRPVELAALRLIGPSPTAEGWSNLQVNPFIDRW